MSSDENKDKNYHDPDMLRYEHGRWITKDKSTKKSVFLTCFIFGCFFSLLMVFACSLTKYSDDEKNGLKWFGAFLGGLFQIFVIMFVSGIIQLNAFYIIFGLLVSICVMAYVIKKYRDLKEDEKTKIIIPRVPLNKDIINTYIAHKLFRLHTKISEEHKNDIYGRIKTLVESGELSPGNSLTEEDIDKIDKIFYDWLTEKQPTTETLPAFEETKEQE